MNSGRRDVCRVSESFFHYKLGITHSMVLEEGLLRSGFSAGNNLLSNIIIGLWGASYWPLLIALAESSCSPPKNDSEYLAPSWMRGK
jgi:hypothetical protein